MGLFNFKTASVLVRIFTVVYYIGCFVYFPYILNRCGNAHLTEDKVTCPNIEGLSRDLYGVYQKEKNYDFTNYEKKRIMNYENIHHYLLHSAFTVGSVLFIFSGFLIKKAGGASGRGPWVVQYFTFLFILMLQTAYLILMEILLPRKSLLHYIGFSALSLVTTSSLCISEYIFEYLPVKNKQWFIEMEIMDIEIW